jgi:CDP-diacylglycerol--glycerol-3-phosphate 3-phosphatidyltransferase
LTVNDSSTSSGGEAPATTDTARAERQLSLQTEPGLWPPTWPMGLTFLRLFLLPLFLFVMLSGAGSGGGARQYHWWAVAIFGVMAVTDKLDGWLARKLGQTSKIGQLLDPIADKLLVGCSVILLSFEWVAPHGYAIPKLVVALVYAKDLVVALGALALLYLVGRVSITPRLLGKAGTFLQLALILATLLATDLAMLLGESATRELVRILWWAVGLVSAASMIDYFVQGVKQLREGRKKKIEPRSHEGHEAVPLAPRESL